MSGTTTARSFVDVFRFVGTYWSKQALPFAAVFIGMMISVALEVQIPTRATALVTALRQWAVHPTDAGPALDAAMNAGLMLLGTFALVSLAQQLYIRLYIHLAADVMRRIVNDGFGRVQRFGTDWHTNNFAGATVRKITRGMWAYDNLADMMVINLGPATVLLFAFTVTMAWRDVWLGLYFGGAVTVFMIISAAMSLLYVAPANERSNEADTKMGGALADAVTCNPVVKGFGAEGREDERMQEITVDWRDRSRRAWRRSVDAGGIQSMMLVGLLAGLVSIVMRRVSSGAANVDELVYVLTTYFVVNGYLRNVGWQIRELQRSANELDDVVEIAKTQPHIADRDDAVAFQPGAGHVRFETVEFKYKNQASAVFEDLDVEIAPGEKIALVGPSGAGKTTFVKLLQRLYDVTGGRILVDGQDVSCVSQSSLRQAFAIVPQDPILFHRTLAENIAYGAPNAGRAAIENAARQAHAHAFIERLPQGYDTLVGERGIKLSGGERQRVAIARAILADAPFLILDEATSSLDSATEQLIQRAVEEAQKGRTALVIAHRLSTVRKADRILVFENGQIVEQGTHDVLMARPDGAYRRLHDVQALGLVDNDEPADAELSPPPSHPVSAA